MKKCYSIFYFSPAKKVSLKNTQRGLEINFAGNFKKNHSRVEIMEQPYNLEKRLSD